MELRRGRICALALVLLELWVLAPGRAQQTPDHDTDYAGKRQKARELFQGGKRLEALPLLEELVRANPKEDEVLVELAASLVDHAVTLTDQQAAGQER